MLYLRYLKQLLKHKYFVLIAGIHLGVPIWRLIIHDWQKFTPQEFPQYARYFMGGKQTRDKIPFMYAWLHHVHHGPHHWQYWYLHPKYTFATSENGCLPMPETYIREMVADWLGASRVYTGSWNITEWTVKMIPRMQLHSKTKIILHDILCNCRCPKRI